MIDQNLASFSDLAYRSAWIVYVLALVLSTIFYGAAGKQKRLRQLLHQTESVAATAGGGVAVATVSGGEEQETSRLEQKYRQLAGRMSGATHLLVGLGVVLHGAAMVLRGLAAHRFPWGNLYEYVLLISFVAMLVAFLFVGLKELQILWPWILTPVVVLLFYGGTKLYVQAAPVAPALRSFWLPIHISVVSIGAGVGLLSGVTSLLYVLRRNQPAGKEHGPLAALVRPLPRAQDLDVIAYRMAVFTVPIFGLGIICGAIWAESAWGRFWGWDPKETVSLITWIMYAAYLHARSTPEWRKAAAYINIAAFALMVFNLFFINLVVSGLHSYAGLN